MLIGVIKMGDILRWTRILINQQSQRVRKKLKIVVEANAALLAGRPTVI